ncbi:hypothetical protein ACFY36_00810 [Actinoplanes sp. NPDC000266]
MDAIEQLCSILTTSDIDKESKPQYIRFAHFEHGHFLNGRLHGFAVLGTEGKSAPHPRVKLDRTTEQRIEERWNDRGLTEYLSTAKAQVGTELRSVNAASREDPFNYAVVINSSVEQQIEVCLNAIESTLSRAKVAAKFLKNSDMATLNHDIQQSDTATQKHTAESVRMFGWQATAKRLKQRAEAASTPLVVTFGNPIFDVSDLAIRTPVLRRVYNEMPSVRRAIDVVATLLSRGLTLRGNASDTNMRKILDMLDIGALRNYLAHLARDAFVCGNGYLSFSDAPDVDIRLLKPENTRLCDDPSYAINLTSGERVRVLHITGATQLNSRYGVSQLEPLVAIVGQHDILMSQLYLADASSIAPSAPTEAKDWAARSTSPIEAMAADARSKVSVLLGEVTNSFADPPQDLYFSGLERMSDSSPLFIMSENQSDNPTGGTFEAK